MSCSNKDRNEPEHEDHSCGGCSNTPYFPGCLFFCARTCYWNKTLPENQVVTEAEVVPPVKFKPVEEEFYVHSQPGMYRTYQGPSIGHLCNKTVSTGNYTSTPNPDEED